MTDAPEDAKKAEDAEDRIVVPAVSAFCVLYGQR
jgi:hypothetical protein